MFDKICSRCSGLGRVSHSGWSIGRGSYRVERLCEGCGGSGYVERFNPFLAVFLALVALYFVWQFTR